MSPQKKIISIYKSSKVDELYVYVEKSSGTKSIPDALKEKMGQVIHVSDMLLTDDKKLARADADKVLSEVSNKGFYLQMPPAREEYMLDLFRDTSYKYRDVE